MADGEGPERERERERDEGEGERGRRSLKVSTLNSLNHTVIYQVFLC